VVLLRRVHGDTPSITMRGTTKRPSLAEPALLLLCGSRPAVGSLAYVEMNPSGPGLRNGPATIVGPSAGAHLRNRDAGGLIDLGWWRRESDGVDWGQP